MNIFFCKPGTIKYFLDDWGQKTEIKNFRIINVNAYCDSLLSPCRLHLSGNYENQQSLCKNRQK